MVINGHYNGCLYQRFVNLTLYENVDSTCPTSVQSLSNLGSSIYNLVVEGAIEQALI